MLQHLEEKKHYCPAGCMGCPAANQLLGGKWKREEERWQDQVQQDQLVADQRAAHDAWLAQTKEQLIKETASYSHAKDVHKRTISFKCEWH